MSVSEEEKRNSDPYGIKDMQEYLLKILVDIDDFCKRNEINYSLNGGTLLGAIRHKGFIPWDDDADIMFDRKNYEKFIERFQQNQPDEYEIIGDTWVKRVTRKDNPRKQMDEGCVDLFVMDNIPNNPVVSKVKNFTLKALQGMLKKKIDYRQYKGINKVLVAITHVMGKPFGTKFKQKMYMSVSKWGNRKKTKKKNIYNSMFRQIGLFEYSQDMMDNYIDVEFENTELRGISDYHQYLTVAYGDYMKLPPVEKRRPMHKKEQQ
ncbi:MAG: LicD family protein [Lachnospiraceae bacterium]|nr:LicD family protein [Lachnospiraceae bacterium]